jgi:hypothetical protein
MRKKEKFNLFSNFIFFIFKFFFSLFFYIIISYQKYFFPIQMAIMNKKIKMTMKLFPKGNLFHLFSFF